jgi:hypothetical protein
MFVSIFQGGLSTGFAGVLFDAYISKHTGTLTRRWRFQVVCRIRRGSANTATVDFTEGGRFGRRGPD